MSWILILGSSDEWTTKRDRQTGKIIQIRFMKHRGECTCRGVRKVMMELFFWDRKSEGKGRSVQEASVNQFLEEEFDVAKFGVLDA